MMGFYPIEKLTSHAAYPGISHMRFYPFDIRRVCSTFLGIGDNVINVLFHIGRYADNLWKHFNDVKTIFKIII